MNNSTDLPSALESSINGEPVLFTTKAKHGSEISFIQATFSIIFIMVFLLFPIISFYKKIYPSYEDIPQDIEVIKGYTVSVGSNSSVKPEKKDNPKLLVAVIIVCFILVSSYFVYFLLVPGDLFIGIPTKLIVYDNGKIMIYRWKDFSGDITMSGSYEHGTLTLELRTGKRMSKEGQPLQYLSTAVSMIDIPNIGEIEKICRERIKANDPTPVIKSNPF